MQIRQALSKSKMIRLNYVYDKRKNAVKGAPPSTCTSTGTNPNPKVMEEIEILQKQ